jgi:hypothetical protein
MLENPRFRNSLAAVGKLAPIRESQEAYAEEPGATRALRLSCAMVALSVPFSKLSGHFRALSRRPPSRPVASG